MKLPSLILASASPRRQELLRQIGVEFEVMPAQVTEIQHPELTVRELCLLNAGRKARAVARQRPDRLVLGADTLVCLGRRLYGKPRDRPAAIRMLEELSGHEHEVITAVCLRHHRHRRERVFAETTRVRFRSLTADEIRRYFEVVDPLDKAGAYALQEHGERIVESIDGSYSNVVGLPLERLLDELHRWVRDTAR